MEKYEYSETAGIKIITDTISAELIGLLKKYRKDSISTIKDDVLTGSYAFSCNYVTEIERLRMMVDCYEELVNAGFTVHVYFANMKKDIGIIKKWLKRSDEIDAEQDRLIEEEAIDDEITKDQCE